MPRHSIWLFILSILALSTQASELIDNTWKVEDISAKALVAWSVYGDGELAIDHQQLVMGENENSKGDMLVSPSSYGDNVIIRYDVMVLDPSAVYGH